MKPCVRPLVHGIDVSSYQHPIDWRELHKSRVQFVVAKLSQGAVDDQFKLADEAAHAAKRCGLDFTVYHFVDKQLAHSADDEAAHFGRLFRRLRHLCTWPPVLDLEPDGTGNAWGGRGLTRAELAAWCVRWAKCVGRVPILYYPARRSFVPELLAAMPRSPRWPSSRPYRPDPKGPDMPPDEPDVSLAPDDWDLWQYSSRCDGIPGINGRCDRDVARDPIALRLLAA